ncbi:MAG: DUF6090 family protein [Bacteroidetes bacterium]|nr:DUF6090 family protein [Bacteroidota bacterium]MDA1119845.1 DUF6090 family protein [Bacteroidota bacterium]
MKKILETLKLKWPEYLLEIMVITIGILLAFGLNNWNENRKQSKNDIDFLISLKAELSTDTAALSVRKSRLMRINDETSRTLNLFDSADAISDSEYVTISLALGNLSILTPSPKNERFDFRSNGTLNRISKQLNQKFLVFLERLEHDYVIFQKLGEELEKISTQYIHPKVDFDFMEGNLTNRRADFQFDNIKNDRLVKNALHRSFLYRKGEINSIEQQIQQIEEILSIIEEHLSANE